MFKPWHEEPLNTVYKTINTFPWNENRVYFMAVSCLFFPPLCSSSSHYSFDMIYF